MRKGMSGAEVTVQDGFAVKWSVQDRAAARLTEQGAFMRSNPDVFPRVMNVFPYGYVMEEMRSVDEEMYRGRLLETITCLLNMLWGDRTFEPVVGGQWPGAPDHRDYISAILNSYKIRGVEYEAFLAWHDMLTDSQYWMTRVQAIHGDPTFANVMQDTTNAWRLRLIDPIPASERMPRMLAVDLGKLLQSALGYEYQIGYRGRLYTGSRDKNLVGAILLDHSEWDQKAAWYFCFCHLARALPYHEPTVVKWLRDEMSQILFEQVA